MKYTYQITLESKFGNEDNFPLGTSVFLTLQLVGIFFFTRISEIKIQKSPK